MKLLAVLFLIGAFYQAEAARVQCVTQPASTSFFFDSDKEKASLVVIHHNGVEHAPLINGIVTGYTLDIAKERLDYVTKMGESFRVDFNLDRCRFDAADDLSCFFPDKATVGSLNVESYYFSVFKEVSQTKFGDFITYRVGFDYRINGLSHPMTMNYYGTDCVFEE